MEPQTYNANYNASNNEICIPGCNIIVPGYEGRMADDALLYSIIGGLNPAQRFFLGYALAWMVNERPETVASQVRSNEHSPAKFRVNGPLSNIPEFYQAFGIKEGDALWVPDSLRIKIW